MWNTYVLSMKRKNAGQGFSIFELMVALGMGSIVLLLVIFISHDVSKSLMRNQLVTARNQILISMRQSAEDLSALRISLKKTENTQFYACVCGSTVECRSAQSYPLTIFDAAHVTTPIPKFYDSNGVPCDNTSGHCPVEVETKFLAQCRPTLPSENPTPPAACVGQPAEFIAITYLVKQNPAVADAGEHWEPIQGAVYSMTSEISAAGGCP